MKLRFFFIIVFATAFWSCTKYETYVNEVKIVSTSVSEVGSTTAKITITLSGNRWLIDAIGLQTSGNVGLGSVTFFWHEDWEYGKNWEYLKHCEIGGLLPGTTYRWIASIQRDTIIVYGEDLFFTTNF